VHPGIRDHKFEDKDRKIIVSMKYVPLRNAAHMPKEECLRTRYRKVAA
jgi:hypothetical protein